MAYRDHVVVDKYGLPTKFPVVQDALSLNDLQIRDINDINGLDEITPDLSFLDFGNNEITEIKGLDRFTKLETLHLNDNKIKHIQGLEKLTKLHTLVLTNNQIKIIEGHGVLCRVDLLDRRGEHGVRALENPSIHRVQVGLLRHGAVEVRLDAEADTELRDGRRDGRDRFTGEASGLYVVDECDNIDHRPMNRPSC